ncbi:hypothetical protein BDF20DRAFT_963552 [Mycotypha africana]|uniref:uncharacterized protein n=1 Tax=Mycotypha africana TaxID=64632 RepID=UPI002301084E|nr:uncharacterized protein BDF20DRAFT_963552 [Mycotypha africana]KAI8969032.1 hypothetical protein BDF20DRAFT_963552 [Mycotypha africana]
MSSNSPIASVPDPNDNTNSADNLIYQQQPQPLPDEIDDFEGQEAIPQKLKLDLRGTRIDLDRDTLINLPESLLIAMFPNGLILPRPASEEYDDFDEDYDNISRHSIGVDEQVNFVDFDPACLEYVLKFYSHAAEVRDRNQQDTEIQQMLNNSSAATSPVYYTLLTKQPIIVLREELEYFCLPTEKNQSVKHLKLSSGQYLKKRDHIFEALQRNISRENNVAEQHLIDMLCDAGFHRDDRWGYREIEPLRTIISSMALVLLKTVGPDNHMATAQKLFLFWRKPARKCWWDGNTVELEGHKIRLWARRTWTLELALV